MFGQVFLVGSGKGGVGKSTVSVNLAVALAQAGLRVALLDADIYGPSIPIMFGLRKMSPRTEGKRILPFNKFGVQVMSIGFFVEEARSVLWRGPMLHGMLQRLIQDVVWGETDVLIVDLPPGTGDVPMSLAQLLKINGAVMVTTPQEVAIADVVKAMNSLDQLQIPVVGLIENMSGFVSPGGDVLDLFGSGKGAELAKRFGVAFLGAIPILPAISYGGDIGIPVALHRGEGQAGDVFHELAVSFCKTLGNYAKLVDNP